jgi:hypothetical protein
MSNPYLPNQAQAITSQVTNNLQRQVLPGINSGAMASGGFGGSRHGIAQGLAIGETNQGLSNSLANLYGGAYEGDQNRNNQMQMQQAALASQQQIASMNDATQRMGLQNQYSLGMGNLGLGYTQTGNQFALGMGGLGLQNKGLDQNFALGNKQADNSYNLGLGGLGLQNKGLDQNYSLGMGSQALQNKSLDQGFYTNQRGQDLQQLGLGSQLMNQGNLGLQQGGQGLYNLGQQQMQNGLYPLQQYGQMLSPFTGLNQTQSQTTPGASTIGSALGGALTAAQIWQLLSGGAKP